MSIFEDPRLQNVTSRGGRRACERLLHDALQAGWIVTVHGRIGGGPGTFVPHVQFRRTPKERPYPFSLTLNPGTPTFYVRRPTDRQGLLDDFDGAHLNTAREVKIPVPDTALAERLVARFLSSPRARQPMPRSAGPKASGSSTETR